MNPTKQCQVTVTHLSQLASVIPSDFRQLAAVYQNGVWVVNYFASIVPEGEAS